MGRDKATLLFEGVPMAVRVANSLRAGGCSTVVAVGGDRQVLGSLGFTVVPDAVAGIGPIGGLLAALQHGSEWGAVVTMSCDVPRLTGEEVLIRLAEQGHPPPVILISADKGIVRFNRFPFIVKVLTKPFELNEFVSLVNEQLSSAKD